ncbi:hypothetical protein PVT67_10655 [Gallaecimonas kandeliae]|uniref:tetratricopeptide repeat protein n=1 Tax=Gallaecimonas kandeliae TaxID=3029055 RepID=UPI002647C744|nr:tetratricopeptide repeat protein [Gallaecimonas kandeliae]WKE64154.1 hypothetical protein PVT67_10655 [Gallaecimonas kandeliae]
MRLWLLLVLILPACRSLPPEPHPPVPQGYWQDAHFSVHPALPSQAELFQITPQMQSLLDSKHAEPNKADRLQELLILLFKTIQPPIRYHAEMTLPVSEVMTLRRGNCLSLSMFTTVMARAWGLKAELQRVAIPPRWSRSGDLITLSQHVNVRVKTGEPGDNVLGSSYYRVVDFQKGYERYGLRAQPISDEVAASFFYHNLAASWLVNGKLSESYWAVKKSLELAPLEGDSWNLLGVIYRRADLLPEAEAVYRHALVLEAKQPSVWQNLSVLYHQEGKEAMAKQARQESLKLMPENPFDYIDQGEQALQDDHIAKAKDLFGKALEIDDINEEALWGMAKAYAALGQTFLARKFLDKAVALASTPEMAAAMAAWGDHYL